MIVLRVLDYEYNNTLCEIVLNCDTDSLESPDVNFVVLSDRHDYEASWYDGGKAIWCDCWWMVSTTSPISDVNEFITLVWLCDYCWIKREDNGWCWIKREDNGW